jgi:hypothetical protein
LSGDVAGMMTGRSFSTFLAVAVSLAPVAIAVAVTPARPPGEVSGAMAAAATRFLAALTPEQRKLAQHPFGHDDRQSLKFVPMARSGLPLKALDAEQRKLALALWKTGLSTGGYDKVSKIVELEKVLAELEKNPVRRDPELYYFWVFGTPDAKGTWAWKAEGHHLSFNYTVVKGNLLVSTPSFMGANPAEVRTGELKGRRVLAAEEDRARKLVQSFTGESRTKVIFDSKALPDIVTRDQSQAERLPEVGVEVKDFKPEQKSLLRELLAEYALTMPAPLAQERLAKIDKAGFERIRFGWAGGTDRGQPHYYRIQGPSFLIEFDNTQNDANHIHTVWRDFAGDYGRDLLREHRAADHGGK